MKLGFRVGVQGSGLKRGVQSFCGAGSTVIEAAEGPALEAWFRVSGLGVGFSFRVSGLGVGFSFQFSGLRFRNSGFGFIVSGLEFMGSGRTEVAARALERSFRNAQIFRRLKGVREA